MGRLVSIVVLIGLVQFGPALKAELIHPGEKLVINFSFSGPPIADNGQPIDFIWFLGGASFIDFTGTVTFRLYDGATLLGSATTPDHRADWSFAPANSEWIDAVTTIVDFNSIADGTIQGHFEFVPTFIHPDASSSIYIFFSIITGDALDPNSFWRGPEPSSGVQVVPAPVPEPTDSALLLLLGTLILAGIFPWTDRRLHRRDCYPLG